MHSMTGYGACTLEKDGRSVTIELKSVNHRFLDLSLRAPRALAFAEDALRKHIARQIARGHIEVYIAYRNRRSDARSVHVDIELAKQYRQAYHELGKAMDVDPLVFLSQVAQQPDILEICEAAEDEDAVLSLLLETLDSALDALIAMRKVEGERMREALSAILDEIDNCRRTIEERYPETLAEYENRLVQRLMELLGENVDKARVIQEVAIMADKAAINEETVRLHTHIEHARGLLDSAEPVGRSLDFLVQEMNREVNTISSKSQDIPITQAVVQSKSAIEKLREQLQNIE